jgi:hypothetical protein
MAHWNFDEGSGTAVDDVVGDYDGTLAGGTWTVDGKINSGLTFSENNDYVDIGSLDLVGSWSIEAWFKYPLTVTSSWNTLTRGSSTDHQIIVQRSSMLLGTYVGGFISSGYNVSNLSTGWHHIVAVGKFNSTHFYIDGQYVGTALSKSDSDIRSIGNYWGGGQQFGTVDEVKVYDTALDADEIELEYLRYEAGIRKIIVNDVSGGGPGIQSGDQVFLYFSTQTNASSINASNIDDVLIIDGHSWKDGNGSIEGAFWSSTDEPNDTLIISISADNGMPSVAIGDTVALDNVTIQTVDGRPFVSSKIITDSVFHHKQNFCDLNSLNLNGSTTSINNSGPIHFNGGCVLRLTDNAWQNGSAFLSAKAPLRNPTTLEPDGSC